MKKLVALLLCVLPFVGGCAVGLLQAERRYMEKCVKNPACAEKMTEEQKASVSPAASPSTAPAPTVKEAK